MNQNEFLNKDSILAIIGIIFLIGLAIFARVTVNQESTEQKNKPESTPTPTATPENTENKETSLFDSLDSNNYHFTYTVTQNEKIEIIDGKINGNKMKFSIIGEQKEEYARVSENYLKLNNGTYQILETEIRSYFRYIKVEEMKKVMDNSITKTEGNNKTVAVDITDLIEMYTEEEYDGFEEFKDDKIIIYFDENQKIEKIELDYSNYFTHLNNQPSIFKVVMDFDQYGQIEELEI